MANRFTVEAVFKAIDRISAPVSRMQNRIGKFTRSFTSGLKKINRGVDGMLRGMRRFGLVAVVAIAGIGAVLANVILTGAKFEQTLVSAAVKFPGEIRKGTAAYQELNDAARAVGKTTEFTAQQAAEGLNFLAFAGFSARESIAALPGVIDLATVAQVGLGRATDIATDTLGAFNLLAGDAETKQKNLARVSDLLVTASISANTSLEQMFDALVAGAPIAVAAGQSIEDVAAFIGIMANAGIKGSKAGRSLKNMITNLAAPGTKAAKVLKDLGVETQDINKDMNRGIEIFKRFGEATKDLGSAERVAAFNEVFGKIALAGSINIASATDQVESLSQSIKDNVGITKKMAAVIRDTFEGRLNSLKSSIEDVKIGIFELTEGPLSDLVVKMTEWVDINGELIAQRVAAFILLIATNADKILVFLRNFGIAIGVFFVLITVLKTLIAVMTIVNLVMAANPIVLITLGVLALITALILLIVFWDEWIFLLRKMPLPIQLLGVAIIGLIAGPMTAFRAASEIFAEQWENVKDRFASAWRGMIAITKFAVRKIVDLIKQLTGGDFGRILKLSTSLTVAGFQKLFELISGGGGEEASAAQVLSPSERTARSIEEHKTTNESTVTLRTEPGTSAEVTKGNLGGGISLVPSGSF